MQTSAPAPLGGGGYGGRFAGAQAAVAAARSGDGVGDSIGMQSGYSGGSARAGLGAFAGMSGSGTSGGDGLGMGTGSYGGIGGSGRGGSGSGGGGRSTDATSRPADSLFGRKGGDKETRGSRTSGGDSGLHNLPMASDVGYQRHQHGQQRASPRGGLSYSGMAGSDLLPMRKKSPLDALGIDIGSHGHGQGRDSGNKPDRHERAKMGQRPGRLSSPASLYDLTGLKQPRAPGPVRAGVGALGGLGGMAGLGGGNTGYRHGLQPLGFGG